MQSSPKNKNQPMFNVPSTIVVLSIVMIALHVFRVWLLPNSFEQKFILLFALIPARYGEFSQDFPYAFAAWLSPLSYALLHANWAHLFINLLWMLAFGSPVAMRFGCLRFLALAIVGALAGALFYLLSRPDQFAILIGSSGAVSAFMGATMRLERDISKAVRPLIESLKKPGFSAFILIWFVVNYLFALQPGFILGENAQIAWQSHMGGFLAGLLLFGFFDRDAPKTFHDE